MGESPSAPRPWKDVRPGDPAEARAAELVEQAARIPPRQVDLGAGWEAVIERTMKRSRSRTFPWTATVLGMLLLVVAVQAAFKLGLVETDAPRVQASAGAQWHREGDGALILTLGKLEISRPRGQVVLHSPHVTVIAVNARFLADTTASATRVEVYEGEVIVKHEDSGVVVRPGTHRTWPEGPAMPSALVLPPAAPERCADELGPERRACLWNQAEQPGLIAQAALFELGLFELHEGNHAMAESAWRRSLDRFPDGVLAPEVRLSLLAELSRERRFAEAIELARDFEKLSKDDPRAAEVARFRAQLEGFAALEK